MKNVLASFVALLALAGFAWFITYMLGLTTTTETQWTRAVYLFTGAEAIAFAAAGFFFGREVNRQRAERAEDRADKAQAAEARGTSLAEAIRIKAQGHANKTQLYGLGANVVQATQADFSELVALADRLFP